VMKDEPPSPPSTPESKLRLTGNYPQVVSILCMRRFATASVKW
jgi:hypothetical protein